MSRLKLDDYEVSLKTGFIQENPLRRLPPYFEDWNVLAEYIPQHLKENTLKEQVHKLPVLDISRLHGDQEVKLAHSQLSHITAAYLWGEGVSDPDKVSKVLPKGLAIPYYALFEKYDLQPILLYADGFLSNNFVIDENRPATVDNIRSIFGFTDRGGYFDIFTRVDIASNMEFNKCIPSIQDLLDAVVDADEEKMTRSLEVIAEGVKGMTQCHSQLHELLPLEAFMTDVGQFFSGYEGPHLPDGLTFEGVPVKPVKLPGPNAAHNPLFKTLDAIMGIEHSEDNHKYTESQFRFLYPAHRRLIYDIRNRPIQLRALVDKSANTKLKQAYDAVVTAMQDFRSYHIQIVTKFVFMGMNKLFNEEQLEAAKPMKTRVMGYLKGMRDECTVEKNQTV